MAEEKDFNYLSTQKEFFGVLKGGFLSKSLGSLNPKTPLCVAPTDRISTVIDLFKQHNIGSALIVDKQGVLTGIFTERDYVLKCEAANTQQLQNTIESVMTKDPVAEPPETTVAFAISLMVHGGFRHIPIVDSNRHPVGIISVKDILNEIGQQFLDDIDQLVPET